MNILSEMTIGSKSFITLCKTAEITIKDNYQYYKKYLASKNKAAANKDKIFSFLLIMLRI